MPPKNHIHDNQPHTKNQAKHPPKYREKWVKCPLLHGVRKYKKRWSVKWEIANEGVSYHHPPHLLREKDYVLLPQMVLWSHFGNN